MSNQSTTFLAIGDVHGQWHCIIDAISEATGILGHTPDMVLQVGDAEALRDEMDLETVHVPNKYRSMGAFSALAPGDLACPVYFIGGNHEPYEALDTAERDAKVSVAAPITSCGAPKSAHRCSPVAREPRPP